MNTSTNTTTKKEMKMKRKTKTRPARPGDIVWTEDISAGPHILQLEIVVDEAPQTLDSGVSETQAPSLTGQLFIPCNEYGGIPTPLRDPNVYVMREKLVFEWGYGGTRRCRTITMSGDYLPTVVADLATELRAEAAKIVAVVAAHAGYMEAQKARTEAAWATLPVVRNGRADDC